MGNKISFTGKQTNQDSSYILEAKKILDEELKKYPNLKPNVTAKEIIKESSSVSFKKKNQNITIGKKVVVLTEETYKKYQNIWFSLKEKEKKKRNSFFNRSLKTIQIKNTTNKALGKIIAELKNVPDLEDLLDAFQDMLNNRKKLTGKEHQIAEEKKKKAAQEKKEKAAKEKEKALIQEQEKLEYVKRFSEGEKKQEERKKATWWYRKEGGEWIEVPEGAPNLIGFLPTGRKHKGFEDPTKLLKQYGDTILRSSSLSIKLPGYGKQKLNGNGNTYPSIIWKEKGNNKIIYHAGPSSSKIGEAPEPKD